MPWAQLPQKLSTMQYARLFWFLGDGLLPEGTATRIDHTGLSVDPFNSELFGGPKLSYS